MSEENQAPPEGNTSSTSAADDSWQEVGRQFQALGSSLAQTVRTAWENEETQRRVQEMRTGLEAMVRDVGRAIDESTSTPQAQKLREDAGRAAGAVRDATEQTIQEVRPQLIDALQQVNNELQKLVNRMGTRSTPPAGATDPAATEPADAAPADAGTPSNDPEI
jgi:hypothetical protein